MVDVVPTTPPSLNPMGGRRNIDPVNDLNASVWDANATPNPEIKRLSASSYFDFWATTVWNLVADFGADNTGTVANSGAALYNALQSAAEHDVILIPPGWYDLSDRTSGYSTSWPSIRIIGIGKPTLYIGTTSSGITFTADQSNMLLQGLRVQTLRGKFIAPNTPTARKINGARILDCEFISAAAPVGTDAGLVDLGCPAKNVEVAGCTFGVVSSAQSAIALQVGLRDDVATRGGAADWYYNMNGGAGGTNREFGINVHHCTFQSVSSISTTASHIVRAISLSGYSVRVSDCEVDTVHKAENSNCQGIYVDAVNSFVHDCTLVDAGTSAMIRVDGPTWDAETATLPNISHGAAVVHDCVLRSKNRTDCQSGIMIQGGNVAVHDNKFMEVYVAGAVIDTVGAGLGNFYWPSLLRVEANELFGGSYTYGIRALAPHAHIVRNRISAPRGNVTPSGNWYGILVTSAVHTGNGGAAIGSRIEWVIEHNTVRFVAPIAALPNFPVWAGTGNGYCIAVDGTTASSMSDVLVRDNKLFGFTYTYGGTLYGVHLNSNGTCIFNKIIVDNITDALPLSFTVSLDYPLWHNISESITATLFSTADFVARTRYLNHPAVGVDYDSLGNTNSGVVLSDKGDTSGDGRLHTMGENVTRGFEITLVRTRSGALETTKFTPAGGTSIEDAGDGKGITLVSPGVVHLRCRKDNVLTVESSSAAYIPDL